MPKDRFIFTPAPAGPAAAGVLDLSVVVAVITFRNGEQKVETRVLLQQEAGWRACPYPLNEAGTEAVLALADLSVEGPHGMVACHVPNANQCKARQIGPDRAITPIGPKLRNLNVGADGRACGGWDDRGGPCGCARDAGLPRRDT